MDYRLEAIVLPVTDVDRAKEFYQRAGFVIDVDHQPGDDFRVVQATPPGSPTSIIFGIGIPHHGEPGCVDGLHVVVPDLAEAWDELTGRGIPVEEPFWFGPGGRQPGIDPDHHDYASYATFQDPDGNGWLLQEVPSRS